MASVFYEYIQGEERDSLIEEMEMQCQWDELILMLEMVQRQAEINERRAELKVLQESGSYEDLTYLLEAGEQQAAQNQKGLLQRIFEWFAKMFNNLANAFAGTKQALANADPNAQVNVPSDYLDESEMGKMEAAANAMSKVSNVKSIATIAVAGSALAALGGLVIYNKNKQQREGSPAKPAKIADLAAKIPGLEKLFNVVKGAEERLKAVFEKEPNTNLRQPKTEDQRNKERAEKHGVNYAAVKAKRKSTNPAPTNANNTVPATGTNPAPANTAQPAQNVNASAETEPMFYDDYYMNEAEGSGGFVDIVAEVFQDPKVLLTYIQKITSFIWDKLQWFKNAAASVANNTTGAVSNVAAGAANTAQTAQNTVGTVNAAAQTGEVIANAVQGQNVNASADTEPIENSDKAIYESVFGESYVEVTEEDIVTNDLNKLILDL